MIFYLGIVNNRNIIIARVSFLSIAKDLSGCMAVDGLANCEILEFLFVATARQCMQAFIALTLIAKLTKNGRCLSRTGALSHNSLR